MTPDVINGFFEFIGGCFLCLNVKNLYRDKKLQGVSWLPTVFMSSWGVWNLYYYPSLNQWWSFWGGLWIVSVNTVWLGMIYYYYIKRKNQKTHILTSPPEEISPKTVDMSEKEWNKSVKKIKKAQAKAPKPSFEPRGGLINRRPGRLRRRVLK